MAAPTRAMPESMVGQFYDIDAATTAGSAWAPKTGYPFARGFLVVTAGTTGGLVVTCPGPDGGIAGGSGVTISYKALTPGAVIQLAVTAIGSSSTATVQPIY